MPKCAIHPHAEAATTIAGKRYCARCTRDIEAARSRVDRHVEPKECFIWYEGGARGWQAMPGTGCAHWLMHELGRRAGGGPTCMEGYPVRVDAVFRGRREIDVADVRINDIYVTPDEDHTGLVVRVVPSPTAGTPPTITIRHDSSRQRRVAEDDFASHFRGRGTFYR